MLGTTVRHAIESDLAAVVRIEHDSFADPWSVDSFRTSLGLGRIHFLVAEERNHLVRREEAIGFGGEVQAQPSGLGRDAQPGEDRHFLAVSAVTADHWSLPDFRPGSPHQGVEKQPRFVDQHEVGVRLGRFF